MFPAKTSTVDGHSHLFRVFRGWGQCLIQESRFQDWGGQLVFCSKYISALLTQGRHWEHWDCIFLRSKKNNIKWRRRRKFLRVRCRNLAFYITEPLNEPFFAEQKMKNGAAGKKKNQGTAISQRHSRGSTTVLPGGEKMRGKKSSPP